MFKFLLMFCLIPFCLWAQTSPMDTPLKDDGVVEITVDFKKENLKEKVEGAENLLNGTYHYRLYLPPGYSSTPDKKYPCLFIASPGGNAGLGNTKAWVKEKGWVVVMLVESKNGPWPPIFSNFLSAHDDVVERVRIQSGFKFATGFSGGARASSVFISLRPGFAGVILQAAGLANYSRTSSTYNFLNQNKKATVYAIIGTEDGNHVELKQVDKALPEHTRRLLVAPDIKHQWAKEDQMVEALNWSYSCALKTVDLTSDNSNFIIPYREKQYTDAMALPASLEKLQELEDLNSFCKANKLSKLLDVEEVVGKLTSEITELKKDPVIKNEMTAQKGYEAVEQAEISLRKRVKDQKMLGRQIVPIAQKYGEVAKKYADTLYGKKCQEKLDSIKSEFGLGK